MDLNAHNANSLSRAELVKCVKKYACDERDALAFFLLYAAEAERRKVYRFEGKNSLFRWFRESFGMSESAACRRIQVVKFLARHGELEEKITSPLRRGEIHLDGLALVLPFLTQETLELLDLIKGKSTREIDLMLAQKFPQQAKKKRKDKERAVVVPVSPISEPMEKVGKSTSAESFWSDEKAWRDEEREVDSLQLNAQKVTLGLEITTTLEGSEIEDLRRLQELMPGVSLKEIIAGALKTYRNKKDPALSLAKKKEKAAPKQKSKAEKTCPNSELNTFDPEANLEPSEVKVESSEVGREAKSRETRRPYISIHIRREVYKRDQGQCTYVSESGERCKAKGHLEIDHIRPVAQSGVSSAGNCRLLCRSHNQLLAELHFGRDFIERKRNAG